MTSVTGPGFRAGDAIKRAMDIVGAGVALVVLSPVIAAIAVSIFARDGRPILYRQTRPGLRGRPFPLIKFRTMRPPRANEVWYETDADRVTNIGRFLRRTSLDELPELWNVLRGEMSLVGPRPLLVEYLSEYTPEQARRHDVRPGLTSWAIVNGRHTLKFHDRLSLDVWYVDHRSLTFDLRILILTLRHLAKREDTTVTQDIREIGFPLPRARRAETEPDVPHGSSTGVPAEADGLPPQRSGVGGAADPRTVRPLPAGTTPPGQTRS